MTAPKAHTLPDDAHDALEAAMDATGVDYGPNTADYYIAAVWPHLYAAALRHAVLSLPSPTEIVLRHGVSPSAGGGVFVNVIRRELVRLADEAT